MQATQSRLWKDSGIPEKPKRQAKPKPAEIEAKWRRFQRRNREAARIILANPQRYEGLPLEWARAFMALDR